MKVRVYLSDEVENLQGFREEKGAEGQVYCWLDRTILWYDFGKRYISLSELPASIPEKIVGIVTGITLHDKVILPQIRSLGLYNLSTAEAQVSWERQGDKFSIRIRMRAKKLEDLSNLYRQILAGSVRPFQSYEGSQGGSSYKELEAENAELKAKLDHACREIAENKVAKIALEADLEESRRVLSILEKSRDEVINSYREIVAEFEDRFFFSKNIVITRLNKLGQKLAKLWTPEGRIFCQNCGDDVLPTIPMKVGSELLRTCSVCGCVIGAPVGKCS